MNEKRRKRFSLCKAKCKRRTKNLDGENNCLCRGGKIATEEPLPSHCYLLKFGYFNFIFFTATLCSKMDTALGTCVPPALWDATHSYTAFLGLRAVFYSCFFSCPEHFATRRMHSQAHLGSCSWCRNRSSPSTAALPGQPCLCLKLTFTTEVPVPPPVMGPSQHFQTPSQGFSDGLSI